MQLLCEIVGIYIYHPLGPRCILFRRIKIVLLEVSQGGRDLWRRTFIGGLFLLFFLFFVRLRWLHAYGLSLEPAGILFIWIWRFLFDHSFLFVYRPVRWLIRLIRFRHRYLLFLNVCGTHRPVRRFRRTIQILLADLYDRYLIIFALGTH